MKIAIFRTDQPKVLCHLVGNPVPNYDVILGAVIRDIYSLKFPDERIQGLARFLNFSKTVKPTVEVVHASVSNKSTVVVDVNRFAVDVMSRLL